MGISYRNGVAIGEIAFYSPVLPVAIYLMVTHGWRKQSGWLFLAAFAIARLLGAAMQLATIHSPDNINLYIGAATLANIGLSPLLLASLGFLSRITYTIHKSHQTLFHPLILRLIEALTILALILSIVGATSLSSSAFTSHQHIKLPTTSTVSVILFLVAFGIILLSTAYLWFYIRYAEQGEKRLLAAVSLSTPFLLVRLIYTALATLRQDAKFSWITGSVTIFLVMALVMEAIIVVVYLVTGLTLRPFSKEEVAQMRAAQSGRGTHLRDEESVEPQGSPRSNGAEKQGGFLHTAKSLGKKTMIGRLVVLATGK